jgi:hypothetical protein
VDLSDIFTPTDSVYVSPPPPYTGTLVKCNSQISPDNVFFAINPLDPNWQKRAATTESAPTTPRFGLNVTTFRNFIFESDVGSLEEQLNEWNKLCEILPIRRLTFSGNKSYHAIISLIDEPGFEPHTLEGVSSYRQAWKGLKGFIEANSTLRLDSSTKDPSRLTRIPGAIRDGKIQFSVQFNSRYLSCDELMKIMAQFAPTQAKGKKATGPSPSSKQLTVLLNRPEHMYLKNKIYNVGKWAATENMYPAVFRLTCWAIDELNVTQADWTHIMQTLVFPKIKSVGYTRDLTIGIRNAYSYKGL